MYITLILFFGSLIGITIMIWKKLFSLKKQQVVAEEEFYVRFSDLQKIRHQAIKNTREYGYIIIVAIIRFFVRASKFFRLRYEEIKSKIKSKTKKHFPAKEIKIKPGETSSFLKKMSEYKHKIRKIKNKVVEEEKEN